MGKIILYHGTPDKIVVPKFGGGDDKHDYGRGFYLTENIELAKEWAVCRPNDTNGWVHKYELETAGLKILDFQQHSVLAWLAELMKHRDAADSKRYRMLAKKFIEKYGMDTRNYDVICGWRANASYFYIAKEFVRDNIDVDILEDLLSLGGLGIQYCIKSEAAYANLKEITDELLAVDYTEFNDRYNQRDITARKRMRELVDSDTNTVTKVHDLYQVVLLRQYLLLYDLDLLLIPELLLLKKPYLIIRRFLLLYVQILDKRSCFRPSLLVLIHIRSVPVLLFRCWHFLYQSY